MSHQGEFTPTQKQTERHTTIRVRLYLYLELACAKKWTYKHTYKHTMITAIFIFFSGFHGNDTDELCGSLPSSKLCTNLPAEAPQHLPKPHPSPTRYTRAMGFSLCTHLFTTDTFRFRGCCTALHHLEVNVALLIIRLLFKFLMMIKTITVKGVEQNFVFTLLLHQSL